MYYNVEVLDSGGENMQFSQRLKELRKQNNWTQEELAKKLNISPGSIGLYEQGRRNPDNKMLKKIALLFDVSIDFLIGFSYDETGTTIDTNNDVQNILFPQMLYYNGLYQSKQELAALMQSILDNISDENQLNQIKMFLETYKK